MAADITVESGAVRVLGRARRRIRARGVRWIATGVYGGAIVAIPFVSGSASFATLVFGVGFVAWLVELASGMQLMTAGAALPGRLELSGTRLTLARGGRTERLDLRDVASGWIEEGDFVVLGLRDRRFISAHVPDEDERRALLEALGVGAAQQVLRVPIYGRVGSVPGGEVMAILATLFVLPALVAGWTGLLWIFAEWLDDHGAELDSIRDFGLVALAATVLAWVLIAAIRSRHAVVGTDGIAIDGVIRRVVPFSEIDRVRLDRVGVVVERKNRSLLRLPTGRNDPLFRSNQTEEERVRAARLLERIQEALAESGRSRMLDQKASWLERSERSIEEWTKQLDALGERGGDYRRPGITVDELLEIAQDGVRAPEQRAAALYLLGRRKGEHDGIRAILDASADPALRKRLAAALEGKLG